MTPSPKPAPSPVVQVSRERMEELLRILDGVNAGATGLRSIAQLESVVLRARVTLRHWMEEGT